MAGHPSGTKASLTFKAKISHKAFYLEAPCQKTYGSQVRVRSLRVQTAVVLDVLESLVHQAAVAALVALWSGAIYQVLLTQRHQLPGLSEVLTLQGPGGAEGPAGATLTLEPKSRGKSVQTKGTTVFTPPGPRSH